MDFNSNGLLVIDPQSINQSATIEPCQLQQIFKKNLRNEMLKISNFSLLQKNKFL
jgi:hypothetical protein